MNGNSINKNTTNGAIRLFWHIQNELEWIGTIEINSKNCCEIYRIIITKLVITNIDFYNYRFERFVPEKRSWTTDLVSSKFALELFITIKEFCVNHYEIIRPQNLVFATTDTKRLKLFRFYTTPFVDIGYQLKNVLNNNYSITLCYKQKELTEMDRNGELELFISNLCEKNIFL